MPKKSFKFNKLTNTEIGKPTTQPKGSKFRRRVLFRVPLTQPNGAIVGIISGNGTEKKVISSLLMREIESTEKNTKGTRDWALKVSMHQLDYGVGSGEDYAKRFFSNFEYSGAEIAQLLDDSFEYSQLGPLFFKSIRQYSREEKTRLLLSITIHVNPKLLYIDDCLMLVKESFFVKVIKSLNLLAESGSSIWLMSTQAKKIAPYCDKLLWLDAGQVRYYGNSSVVLGYYHEHLRSLRAFPSDLEHDYWTQDEANQAEKIEMLKSDYSGDTSRNQKSKKRVGSRAKPLWQSVLMISGYVVVLFIVLSLFMGEKTGKGFSSLFTKETSSISKKAPKDIKNVKTSESPLKSSIKEVKPVESSETTINKPVEVAPFSHKVITGETIGEIADYYGVNLNDLMQINNMTDSTIYDGMTLVLPKGAIVHTKESNTLLQ